MAHPLGYSERYTFKCKLEVLRTHDGFYMHQVILEYMVVFCEATFESWSSGPELSALPTGPPQSYSIKSNNNYYNKGILYKTA